jgi:hypothetical protein
MDIVHNSNTLSLIFVENKKDNFILREVSTWSYALRRRDILKPLCNKDRKIRRLRKVHYTRCYKLDYSTRCFVEDAAQREEECHTVNVCGGKKHNFITNSRNMTIQFLSRCLHVPLKGKHCFTKNELIICLSVVIYDKWPKTKLVWSCTQVARYQNS